MQQHIVLTFRGLLSHQSATMRLLPWAKRHYYCPELRSALLAIDQRSSVDMICSAGVRVKHETFGSKSASCLPLNIRFHAVVLVRALRSRGPWHLHEGAVKLISSLRTLCSSYRIKDADSRRGMKSGRGFWPGAASCMMRHGFDCMLMLMSTTCRLRHLPCVRWERSLNYLK